MKKIIVLFLGCSILFGCGQKKQTVTTFPELDAWAAQCKACKPNSFGYPVNQFSALDEFYQWYIQSGMDTINLNNAGDPFADDSYTLNSHWFERQVIEFFAPYYGFDTANLWGIVTNSGTDGNNHGIYFGANVLKQQTGQLPIVYVSDEAHYSNMRLCDLQNLEVRLIKSDNMGRMIPEDLDRQLDPSRGCLIVYAMGSTLKGAIDDIPALNAVLDKYPQMAIYRHVDAALFGGYLPFTEHRNMIDSRELNYQSISVSGHKFFGIDSPSGLFITSRDIYDAQNNFNIAYLNNNMRMISCSRDAVQPVKFWWLIQKVGADGWKAQANAILANTDYLNAELERIHWPHMCNQYSNTVLFRRPNPELVKKYNLACGQDDNLGGDVAHIVVMQHVTPSAIDRFIADLETSQQ